MKNVCHNKYKEITINHHNNLQNQLSEAICWLKYYCLMISIMIYCKKQINYGGMPQIIHGLAINTLSYDKINNNFESYYILSQHTANNTCDVIHYELKRKIFIKHAQYLYNGVLHQLNPDEILPIDFINFNINDVNLYLLKITTFLQLFEYILNQSKMYILNI